MEKAINFIKWALTHVKPDTIPGGSALVLSREKCGIEPWEYLFGSVHVQTNQDTLNRYYINHYSKTMTRAEYDKITADWDRDGFATDCQGLCDAYLTYEVGEKTDINANMNYQDWCTKKGFVSDIDRDYVIGEALFMISKSTGKMTHVGWVCGFAADGEPLVVEARGIAYGVVITRLDSRNWTHRGLMTEKFDYSREEKPTGKIKFAVTSPMLEGTAYKKMQEALNVAGYTDSDGKVLEIDGKWGKRSQQAFNSLIADYSFKNEASEFVIDSTDKKYKMKITIDKVK